LLSKSWEGKLGGIMQMDMSYATIPVFGGKQIRLYRETKFSYMVSDQNNVINHLVYATKSDLSCCILSIDGVDQLEDVPTRLYLKHKGVWNLYFDGTCSKEGSGPWIVMVSPTK
jgi:hypothetical protein